MESGLFLNQRKYVLDILQECGMLGARPSTFPMEQHHRLTADSGTPLDDPSRYRRLVGRLIYLTITRPELCYPIHILSQVMQDPRQDHWDAAMRASTFELRLHWRGVGSCAYAPQDLYREL
ncbi:hypothetical protein CRG98_021051 [Punica granatum]|uniref:Reverse transcriptase Ty1/copia-type domain-containing protein n=1 Tax=Punica granatum TaxID=22663 RepID=A0A2I0JQL6_PUNGR|nr:hypothetical protein CRG98_021051 [Punica granatum]